MLLKFESKIHYIKINFFGFQVIRVWQIFKYINFISFAMRFLTTKIGKHISALKKCIKLCETKVTSISERSPTFDSSCT